MKGRIPVNWKPREDRRRTVLPARLRSGVRWTEACILNVSSRGLLIYARNNLQPGSLIEIRRGQQMVFARVVWRNNQRIGLHSPDPLPVAEIIRGETESPSLPAPCGAELADRPRAQRNAERSRESSRAIEFLSLVLVGILFAGAIGLQLVATLGKPLTTVQAAIGAR